MAALMEQASMEQALMGSINGASVSRSVSTVEERLWVETFFPQHHHRHGDCQKCFTLQKRVPEPVWVVRSGTNIKGQTHG
jgi:hypothetical protein